MVSQGELTRLETRLRDLIREWERYFAGDRRVPPIKERDSMGRWLRTLAESGEPLRSADAFRLGQLQQRFATYSQLWERMLREREEGRVVRPVVPGQASTPPPSSSAAASSGNGSEAAPVHSRKNDLYGSYLEARRSLGQEARVSREAFEAQIESQRQRLKDRMGNDVEFRVVVEGGKVKISARRSNDRS
jgi:hypothetical protein